MAILAANPRFSDAKFDWYACTIHERADVVLSELARFLGGEVVEGKPRNGYTFGAGVKVNDSIVATIYYGGTNGHPHAFASSDDTPAFVDAVRTLWPTRHRVSRMDVAIDFDGPGTWDELFGICESHALDRRLKINQAGDWITGEWNSDGEWINTGDGRTFYLGAPSSAVRLRLYEKGKQLRTLALDGGADISLDLVRFEVQVRPDGDARYTAAVGAPEDAFGYSQWSRDLLELVMETNVERVHIKERRESDHERAMFWLIRQYGAHLEDEARLLPGGWADLGPTLFRRIQAMNPERDVYDEENPSTDAASDETAFNFPTFLADGGHDEEKPF